MSLRTRFKWRWSNTEDELTICNFYAMSKLASEFVAATVPSILRTNFVGLSKCGDAPALQTGYTVF